MTDRLFEGLLTDNRAPSQANHGTVSEFTRRGRPWVTIDMLPDVALLEIFDYHVHASWIGVEAWHTLVHVCRKWRNVVFGSPRRLDLRLYCKATTPVREMLDVWPLLPIVIRFYGDNMLGIDNIIAALEHNDRICELALLDIPSSQFEKVLAVMHRPFPALTHLDLQPTGEMATVVPASFLSGSTPLLQTLWLDCVPIQGLSKILLSTTHLVRLNLLRIPYSGYISPEAMVSCLSVLTGLERLDIGFKSPQCRPDRGHRHPPPLTRTLLPALSKLWFKGVGEYLEDLVARIDAPLLDKLGITFFHQLMFDTPQLTQFISRTPNFKALDKARVVFSNRDVWITLPRSSDGALELAISCRPSDWQLLSLAQVCSSSFPRALISTVEHLYILDKGTWDWQDDIENIHWLELLHPFTAVKNLYISWEFVLRTTPILKELAGERVTEVLPSLQTLFLEEPLRVPSGPVQEAIRQFVATRQLAGHPVTISRWNGW